MFTAIYDRHNIPTADRAKLTRYLNTQNGIPASLRHYFVEKKWSRLIKDCFEVLTDRFLTRLRQGA